MPDPIRAVALKTSEWQQVINALAAVSPTGGGSATFTIQRMIMGTLNMSDIPEQVGALQSIAHEEYVNATQGV